MEKQCYHHLKITAIFVKNPPCMLIRDTRVAMLIKKWADMGTFDTECNWDAKGAKEA